MSTLYDFILLCTKRNILPISHKYNIICMHANIAHDFKAYATSKLKFSTRVGTIVDQKSTETYWSSARH